MIESINIRDEPGWLSAAAAVARLRVSRQTLYSYVSRGLVRAKAAPEDCRRSLYSAHDIRTLADRRARGRTRRDVAASTTNWGEPILSSSLTRIADGRFSYRGQDAVAWADHATLEETAALLWAFPCPAADAALPAALPDGTPLHRGLSTLAALAGRSRPVGAAELLQAVVRSLAGSEGGPAAPAHQVLAAAWHLDDAGTQLVRRALVLCADHELNASTYAARVVASTGASLSACVLAGLLALTGSRHGGMTERVRRLLQRHDVLDDPDRWFKAQVQRGADVPGFGHPLYDEGDPRAAALLPMLRLPNSLARAIDVAAKVTGKAPTIDVALAAMELTVRLPRGGGFALFAAGRTVGWIAHALEQRAEGRLIRPRADYRAAAG